MSRICWRRRFSLGEVAVVLATILLSVLLSVFLFFLLFLFFGFSLSVLFFLFLFFFLYFSFSISLSLFLFHSLSCVLFFPLVFISHIEYYFFSMTFYPLFLVHLNNMRKEKTFAMASGKDWQKLMLIEAGSLLLDQP